MTRSLALIAIVLLSGVPETSYAGDANGVTIVNLQVMNPSPGNPGAGIAFVYFSGSHIGTWACSPGAWNRFAVDLATPAGRATYATLLSYYLNTPAKLVNIHGNGDCTLWGDTETLNWLVSA